MIIEISLDYKLSDFIYILSNNGVYYYNIDDMYISNSINFDKEYTITHLHFVELVNQLQMMVIPK